MATQCLGCANQTCTDTTEEARRIPKKGYLFQNFSPTSSFTLYYFIGVAPSSGSGSGKSGKSGSGSGKSGKSGGSSGDGSWTDSSHAGCKFFCLLT